MEYLLAKDTIENGSGITGLDKIIQKLINTKPVSFFKSEFLSDLLVNDRYQMYLHPGKVLSISCHKDYLSTDIITAETTMKMDHKDFEIHKVA